MSTQPQKPTAERTDGESICTTCGDVVDLTLTCELRRSRYGRIVVTRCNKCVTANVSLHRAVQRVIDWYGRDEAVRLISSLVSHPSAARTC